MRDEFEKERPTPPGVRWSDTINDYIYVGAENLYAACGYSAEWRAFRDGYQSGRLAALRECFQSCANHVCANKLIKLIEGSGQ